MIRKKFIHIMIITLLLNIITSTTTLFPTIANADEGKLSTDEKEIRSELADGLNIKDKEVQVDVDNTENQTSVTFNAKSSSSVTIEGQVIVDEKTNKIQYFVNDGKNETFYGVKYDTTKPNLVTFIDPKTKEEYLVNVEETQLSWIPIAIAIGGVVVRGVISIASKNLTKNAIKIAGKTYKGQPIKKAKNALKNYKGDTLKIGKTGKTVKLSSGKLEHILTGHHPKYWKGKDKKTFFDPNLSIKTIRNYIKQTVNGNEKNIKKKSIKKNQTFIVTKKINKVTYKLAIYVDKKGKLTVSSFYPKS